MSTVYLAFDQTLERWVAIKLMHRDISSDPDQLERFRREARAVAQAEPPAHRDGDRRRRGRRHALHRVRVRRGRDPEGAASSGSGCCRCARRWPTRSRSAARSRPPTRQARPPRREAAERPDRRRGARQGHRLRDRPLAGGPGPDRHRQGARHDRLRVAGAGARARGDRAVRHLLARDRALRDAHRRGPVPRRHPGGRRDEARARAAARRAAPASRGVRRAGRRGGALDRQGAAPPLRHRRRDGARPRGGARDRGRPPGETSGEATTVLRALPGETADFAPVPAPSPPLAVRSISCSLVAGR